jgi:hypothetical protein
MRCSILADFPLVALTQSKGPTWDVVAPVLVITCAVAYFVGLWCYIKAKGRSGGWKLRRLPVLSAVLQQQDNQQANCLGYP